VEARLNLAIVLNEMGQYEDALREFNVERLRDQSRRTSRPRCAPISPSPT